MKTVMFVATLVVASALGASDLSAQAGRAKVEEGNRLYQEGRFDEAHQRYLEALGENPESSLIRFNDGNALYQSADFERALEAYQQAIESGDPQLQDAAWYNLGNTLYRAQQLEPSLEAYKQVLRRNPSDVDAKHNLERVLEQMQEEEQPDDQQQNDQEQNEEDNQDQQEDQEEGDQEEGDQGEGDQGEGDQEQDDQGDGEQDEPDEADEADNPDDPQDQDGQAEAQPRETEMSPEEAKRLLDAIDEDPGDVNRKAAPALGRKPRKPW